MTRLTLKTILKLFTILLLLLIQGSFLLAQESSDSTRSVVADTTMTKVDTLAIEVKATLVDAIKDSLQVLPEIDTVKIKQVVSDSLSNYVELPDIALDSTLTDQLKSEAKSKFKDEIGYEVPKIDSATVKREVTATGKELLQEELGVEVPDIKLDSTAVDQAQKQIETKAEEAFKNNSQEFTGQGDQLQEVKEIKAQVDEVQQALKEKAARKELRKKMTTQAKAYIAENAAKVQQVQSQMGELKQLYSSVPNSNDLSTAKKRGSLKGESFWKRLVIGGNFNVTKTNPITLDLSPVLGWKFNKVCEAGFTGTYRTKFGADDKGINSFENEEIYGYGLFANYMIFRNFFGSLEGENMSKVMGVEEDHQREWIQTLLLGIGRKFIISKYLEMQAIVSYNFLHNNTDNLFGSPVVFKTGFRIKK